MINTAIQTNTENIVSDNGNILLLGRAHDAAEGADQAYVLLSVSRTGLENLKKIGAAVAGLAAAAVDFSSAQFFAPIGLDVYLITDRDDEPLESLLSGERKSATYKTRESDIVLECLSRFKENDSVVRLAPVSGELLAEMRSDFAPNFSVDSYLLRFYDSEEFFLHCMFKYAEGSYSLDAISVPDLESCLNPGIEKVLP